jgi:Glycosyl transferase family 2
MGRAIESILAQTYAEWELVIGDNASTDDLEGVVSRYADRRLRLHRWSTHTDLCENFNRTMRLARYEWIQPLGADDRLMPHCLATIARCVADTSNRPGRVSVVLAAAQPVDRRGQAADAAYYGYRGRAQIPSGLHDAASWLRYSLTGVIPWYMGTVAFATEVLAEMGTFLRPEIGLCADVDLVLRAATYGHVLYVDEPLMDFTVRADSDSYSRGFSPRAWRQPLAPLGLALVSALSLHAERREVSRHERAAVYAVVAHLQLQRAFQQRYRTGGHGRRGALLDVLRAVVWSPAAILQPKNLLYALAAILSPQILIRRVRATVLRRSYWGDRETAAGAGIPDEPSSLSPGHAGGPAWPQAWKRWKAVMASILSWWWVN